MPFGQEPRFIATSSQTATRTHIHCIQTRESMTSGDCEPDPALVGAECEPKTPLVCEPIAHCLQAATPKVAVVNPLYRRLGMPGGFRMMLPRSCWSRAPG